MKTTETSDLNDGNYYNIALWGNSYFGIMYHGSGT